MSPTCHRFLFPRLLIPFLVLLAGCLGSDFQNLTFGVEKWDHGWLVAIEPGEEFTVDLLGNNAYPDQQWRVVDYDSAMLRLDREDHQKPRPPILDVEAAEPGVYDEGIYASRSVFLFTGVGAGKTPLRFEFIVDDTTIDIAEYTVEVVQDACEAQTVAVANRCGGDGFTTQPQALHERDYGQEVALETGSSVQLVLTANALHRTEPWQVGAYDDSLISIDGPVALAPARSAGDFGTELDADVSHSFLPAWQFTITGVAAGESALELEIAANGRRLDVFEMDVFITD